MVMWTSKPVQENIDGHCQEQGPLHQDIFFPRKQNKHSHQLFLTSYLSILMQKVTLWKKIHVIYSFFLVRKIIAHIVTFVFYCIVIPATVLVPEVEIPKWGSVYIPTMITLLNAVGTPRYPSSKEV